MGCIIFQKTISASSVVVFQLLEMKNLSELRQINIFRAVKYK